MAGILSALHLGQTGMAASQKALEVVGNNVSNVSTEGYSRQTIESSALPTLQRGGLSFGQGVEVSSIERESNMFILERLRAAADQLGNAEAKASPLTDLERILSIDEGGLSDSIDDFFGAWQDLSLNPGGETEREIVLRSAEVLQTEFNQKMTSLDKLRQSIDSELNTQIAGINAKLGQVAKLNATVQQGLAVGKNPNTALDQRDVLLQELAQRLGATAVEGDNGAVSVQLAGGQTLVQDTSAFTLQAANSGGVVQDFSLEIGSTTIDLSREDFGGGFGGLLNVRDEVVTGVQDEMVNLRSSLIQAVNGQHTQGTDLDGDTGNNFFEPVTHFKSASFGTKTAPANTTGSDSDVKVEFSDGTDKSITIPDGTTFEGVAEAINDANVGVKATVAGTSGDYELRIASTDPDTTITTITNPSSNLQSPLLSWTQDGGGGDSGLQLAIENTGDIAAGESDAPGDNRNAQKMAGLKNEKMVNGRYTAIDFYGKVAADVGVAGQQNDFNRSSFQNTVDQLEARRQEISGVSINESMIKLQRYQKAFQASAQYLTTADEMMQTLLNIKR
ncbi:flagellar hook-associated protein FlgK [Desulfohalobium retbaense]|uniref:Flagellar hook-associated protein 1 n=1 Tax=Desulfohalobium retbaense (strain ATCC 49708 / DSM 5692 / JCM 16813 / HR100) TaxID=485915 RepID=C8WYY3_DESRD|nr:flagellar hook-associated protein FlgK [Desulfohalobium retbaense]ACV67899.1 flagellar hook-associated protein FlgK [Desulfohalobium retbaense DSM 5692]